MVEQVMLRRRSDRLRAELCTFEKMVSTGELTTFRFFLLHNKPIVADLHIDKHAELLQAAFKLCNVDEKNVLNLVGVTYQSIVGEVDSEGHRKLTEEECTQLNFYDPTPLLDAAITPEVRGNEAWVSCIAKEFVYPRGEDTYDIWFHDINHYGRQAVLNVASDSVEELEEDLFAVRLGHANHTLEYAVLQPNGIFQKCHGRADSVGARIDFSSRMVMNQSALSVKYPFVPRQQEAKLSGVSNAKQNGFTAVMTNAGATRSVTPVKDVEQTQRVSHIRDCGNTIRFPGKHALVGGNVK